MLCMKQLRTPIESHLQMLQVFNLMLCLSQLKLDHSVNLMCVLWETFFSFFVVLYHYRRRYHIVAAKTQTEDVATPKAPLIPKARPRQPHKLIAEVERLPSVFK